MIGCFDSLKTNTFLLPDPALTKISALVRTKIETKEGLRNKGGGGDSLETKILSYTEPSVFLSYYTILESIPKYILINFGTKLM